MISQETIATVRDRTDLVTLIGENVRLKRQGRRYVGLCPFHKEKTPSFSVNRERGLFHCFGCKESGTAIDYVMKVEGLNFPEAIRALADRLGLAVEEDDASPDEVKRRERRKREREDLYNVNHQVASFFEAQLVDHPLADLAREEILRRGLDLGDETVQEAMKAFRLGYAPYGWDGLSRYLTRQGISVEAAQTLGLVTARRSGKGTFDAFRHRLMFAVTDKAGRVVAFSGRALAEPEPERLSAAGLQSMYRPSEEERRKPPKYINSPESPIYVKGETVFGLHQGRMAIREAGRAVLVEGNFDVLSLHARGFQEAVAPLGTAFTEGQARLIKRFAPKVVVMFDADKAGKKATAAVRGAAREAGLLVEVATLPEGTDPDDHARSNGVDAVRHLVEHGKGLLEWMIDVTLEGITGATLRGKQARLRRVIELISEEKDSDLRGLAKAYADRLSSKLILDGQSPVDLRNLEQMLQRATSGAPAPRNEVSNLASVELQTRARSRPKDDEFELHVVGALLDLPELVDDPEVEVALGVVDGATALAVAAIRQVWDRKKSLDGPEILDLLPSAIHQFAVGRLASPQFEQADDARADLLKNAEKLRQRSLTSDRTVKQRELARAQQLGDEDAEDELLLELQRVARERRRLE